MILSLALILAGCGAPAEESNDAPDEQVSKVTIQIGTLKGPTGMGMSYLMEMDTLEQTKNDYDFQVVGAPDQLIGKVAQGEIDIAAVPSNLAAILNAKTEGKIQLLGINTLGVLSIVENGNTIHSLEDLAGKTIASSGKGAAPEYILNYLLSANGLETGKDVVVDYALEHGELAASAAAGDTTIALLPQPFVTTVIQKNSDIRIALDITEEWKSVLGDDKPLPMGSIIVRKDFASEHPEAIENFMNEYKISVDYVNSNVNEAGELIAKYEILPNAVVASKAIPNCYITLIPAEDAKEAVLDFYNILFEFNPKSVGGKIPENDFFYQ